MSDHCRLYSGAGSDSLVKEVSLAVGVGGAMGGGIKLVSLAQPSYTCFQRASSPLAARSGKSTSRSDDVQKRPERPYMEIPHERKGLHDHLPTPPLCIACGSVDQLD